VLLIVLMIPEAYLTAQTYDQAPGTAQNYYVCALWNGSYQPGTTITLTLTAYPGTGYHDHTAGRTPGAINTPPTPGGPTTFYVVTGGDGCNYFQYFAPIASGQYAIQGDSLYGTDFMYVNVWINPFNGWIYELPASSDYNLVGATADHSVNHYGTATAVAAIPTIMAQFKSQTGATASVNDMSLPWGGTFDLGPAYASGSCTASMAQYWFNDCVHAEHRAGKNADISELA
jgi:hypothetical protein